MFFDTDAGDIGPEAVLWVHTDAAVWVWSSTDPELAVEGVDVLFADGGIGVFGDEVEGGVWDCLAGEKSCWSREGGGEEGKEGSGFEDHLG